MNRHIKGALPLVGVLLVALGLMVVPLIRPATSQRQGEPTPTVLTGREILVRYQATSEDGSPIETLAYTIDNDVTRTASSEPTPFEATVFFEFGGRPFQFGLIVVSPGHWITCNVWVDGDEATPARGYGDVTCIGFYEH